MKKIILLGSFSILFSVGTFAQTQKTNDVKRGQTESVQSQNNNKDTSKKTLNKQKATVSKPVPGLTKKVSAERMKRVDVQNLKKIKAVKSEPMKKASAAH